MFSVAAFIISSSLLTRGVYSFTENEAWLPTILGIITSLSIVAVYLTLAKRHPGASLVEINDAVFGNVLGKPVSFLYFFFFLSLVVLNMNDMGNFIKMMLLPDTPPVVIHAVFIFLCAMAVRKGAVKLTSYGTLFAVVAIVIIAVHALLLINIAEPKNLLPVFRQPLRNYLLGIQIVTMMPYCEIIVFMMYHPYTENSGALKKGLVKGLLIGSAVLLTVVLRDTMVQGNYLKFATLPTFSTIRLINIGDFLTRLEIIYAVTLMTLYFFKISTLYYAAVSCFCRMLKLNQNRSYVTIFGALAVIYTSAMFKSVAEHDSWKMSTAATYSTFFILILPLVTLSVLLIRSFIKKKARAAP